MKFRILITGKNRKIASADVSRLLEQELGCSVVECQPLKTQLLDAMYAERPSVVLIFIKDEDQKDVKVYDVISEYEKFHSVTVIVVADEANQKTFTRNSRLRKILFLPHDIPLPKLCDRLSELKKAIQEEDKKTQFVEYAAPVAADTGIVRKHILVVDDDSQQLLQIKEHLKDFYEVTLINSGTQILRVLEKYKVDLIFLDYLMPDMNGHDTLKMIREDGRFADIPVVFLTGVNEKETVIKTIKEFLPQGYLLKPTTKIEIVTKVIEILG